MTRKEMFSHLDKQVLAGLKLGVFEDRFGQKLLQLYQRGILDPWTIGQISNRVRKEIYKQAFSASPFKKHRLKTGDLILGFDEYGNPIKSFVQFMNSGALTVANTGSGKTTLICFYAVQIAHQVKGMWLIDLRKKDFRLLRPAFVRKGIDLVIIRGRGFKINPLQVPSGVDPHEYASTIADVLVKVLNLPPRAAVLLTSTIVKLYRKYNVLGGSEKYPTLFHLFEAIRADKTANAQAKQAVLDNLEAILLSFGTDVLGFYKGWSVNELARRHLVFELAGQPEAGKDLILNYLVVSEFISRISRGISNQGMDLWMTIDEGQRLFSQRKEVRSHGGNSITDLAGLVRGSGTGLFISVLTPDDLSTRIPGITSTKIMGRCGSITDYTAAGRFMGLTQDQITWCAHHIVPGTFVGQVGDGTWRYPFLFTVPKLKKLKPVSDTEVERSLKALANLKVEPVEFSHWSSTPTVQVYGNARGKPETEGRLSNSELKLLQAVINYPMRPSSDYVKLARISPNTLRKLRPILIKKGFIKEHLIDSGNRGRSKRVWEPTQAGKEAVANNGKYQEQ